jgi:UTP:GlnB (protein PII) uridylyltransferase
LPEGLSIVCVIADDSPGLISLVSAAFVVHGLDIRSAQIYSRVRRDGQLEAVDFFWVREARSAPAADRQRVVACSRTIESFVSGHATPDTACLREPTASLPAAGSRVSCVPRLGHRGQWVLAVEAQDYPGLLHAIARVLFRHALGILEPQVRTERGVARDQFVIASTSDEVFDRQRAEQLEIAVHMAVDGLRSLPLPAKKAVDA